MRKRFLAALLGTVLAGAGLLAGCGGGATSSESAGPAPELTVEVPTLEGGNTSLAAHSGKVVLVNFWATWCAPCVVEIPWFIEFKEKYGPQGLEVLGIAMDEEGKSAVEPFVTTRQFDVNGTQRLMNYPILLGNDRIASQFGGIIGLPTSFVYSRDGRRVKTVIGLTNHDDLVATIESLL